MDTRSERDRYQGANSYTSKDEGELFHHYCERAKEFLSSWSCWIFAGVAAVLVRCVS